MKKRYALISLLVILALTLTLVYAETFRSTKIWSEEDAGTHMFFVSSIEIGVTEIRFDTATTLSNARMVIEAQNETPRTLQTLQNAYQYIIIGKFGIADADTKNILVKFRVPKNWADENSNYTTIKLYMYDTAWKQVETTYLFDDSSYYYYQAQPTKLSYIAFSGDKKTTAKVVEPIKTEEAKETTTETRTPVKEPEAITELKQSPNQIISLMLGFYKNNEYLSYAIIAGLGILFIILYTFIKIITNKDLFENAEEMEKFIQQELAEGVPRNEIEEELIHEGWPRKYVDSIVHGEHLPHDTEIKIRAYINSMRSRMLADDHIKLSLVKNGWSEDSISHLFKETTSS